MSMKDIYCAAAFRALQGWCTAMPQSVVEGTLKEFKNMGGIDLPDSPKDIIEKALAHCGEDARISHVVVNTVGADHDIQISFVISTPEYPIDSDGALLDDHTSGTFSCDREYSWDAVGGAIMFHEGRFIGLRIKFKNGCYEVTGCDKKELNGVYSSQKEVINRLSTVC